MKIKIVLILFALVSACHPRPSYDFVIRDVGLFDGEKDLGIVDIAINGDTIAAISKDPLRGDSILEAKGKYLIPGLVNSHVHIWELDQLEEGYDAGVLAHMGMHASNPVRDSTIKAASANDGYPFYYSSGVAATVPGGHPTQITPNIETINDSISVRQFVDHRVSLGADYIKITKESTAWYGQPDGPPSLPYDSIAKLIEYAHARNRKAVVHIGSLIEMTTIARFKPDGFMHMWYSAKDADLTEKKLKAIKESGAFVVPTARVNERALALAENEGPLYAAWARENFLSMDGLKEAIGKVHRAGITILAGTDNGNFDLNWGDDLINELILYHQSGMSNVEALKTATGNPAKTWGIPVGFLEVGSRANMLLIDGNPLEDLDRLKHIEIIWKNGRTD